MVGEPALSGASLADLPELYLNAVNAGWVKAENGAWLLRLFSDRYPACIDSFADITDCEATINGRGIPDDDLGRTGMERVRKLATRGYAFACTALYSLNQRGDHPPFLSYISVGLADVEDGAIYTGYVTFTAMRDGEPPYIKDITAIESSAVLVVNSEECMAPLPAGS